MINSPATPQRLYLMQVAHLPPSKMPVVCYLIQMTDGRKVLIDTGLPNHVQLPPGRPLPVMGPNVLEQLATLSLAPADIDFVICTHFDMDHAGHLADFSHAEIVVQREHDEAARSGTLSRLTLTREQWDGPNVRLRLIDGDTELLPGLELIETGGHVPGHQSVLVRLPEMGPVLLAIDAVQTQESFTADRTSLPNDHDAEKTLASTRKLLDVAQQTGAKLIIFGHDPDQWRTLKKLPEYYA